MGRHSIQLHADDSKRPVQGNAIYFQGANHNAGHSQPILVTGRVEFLKKVGSKGGWFPVQRIEALGLPRCQNIMTTPPRRIWVNGLLPRPLRAMDTCLPGKSRVAYTGSANSTSVPAWDACSSRSNAAKSTARCRSWSPARPTGRPMRCGVTNTRGRVMAAKRSLNAAAAMMTVATPAASNSRARCPTDT